MKSLDLIRGVYVANFTPFRAGEGLDLPAYQRHLTWLNDAGVQGFVPCGTTGESAALTSEERNLLIETTVAFAKGKGLKVIAGCGSNNTQTALGYLEKAGAMGSDAALVVTPYYNRPTAAGVVAHYRFLAERSPLPIVAYHVPGRTNVLLTPETIGEILALPNVVAVKEASGSFAQWLSLSTQEVFKHKALLAGDDDALAAILALGGTGIISASANVAPKAFVAIQKSFDEKNWALGFEIQKKVLPLVKALFRETSPAPAKKALEWMGFGDGSLRLPLVPITAESESVLRAALKAVEAWP